MPQLTLTTSSQSTAGLGTKRALCLTGSADCKVQIEALASNVATRGPVLKDADGKVIVLGHGSRVLVDDVSSYLRYRVITGTVTACWVDAEDMARGPAGAGGGAFLTKAADDSLAADTLAVFFFRAKEARTITAARYIPNSTLTAHDTNYATLTVSVEDGAGGAVGTAASKTTKITGGSGNWAAGVPVDLALGAAVTLAAGQVLKFAITKAAAGVVVKSGQLQIDMA